MWRHAVYPLGLLLSIGCLLLIDQRYQLAIWHNRRRAVRTIGAAVVYFAIWDLCGVRLDIFYAANSTYRTGLLIGPSFPVEELLFLTLLCYTVLLSWTWRSRRP